MDVAANGGRVRFFRDVAAITMDLDDVESILARMLGGTDRLVANDLSGTDVDEVEADLAAVGGGNDAAPDTVVATGTNGDDVAIVGGAGTSTQVRGLAARVNASGAFAGSDRVTVNALAGDDVVDASLVPTGTALLTIDGGDDDDVLLGGDGDDVLLGGNGDDVLLGGPGTDTIDGGPGSNIVIQGLVADQVTSATTVGGDWLASHTRSVGGKTVLEVGGKERTLPRADMSQLLQQAPAS
jgi:Ca2+-binding RTX toxin-like protein